MVVGKIVRGGAGSAIGRWCTMHFDWSFQLVAAGLECSAVVVGRSTRTHCSFVGSADFAPLTNGKLLGCTAAAFAAVSLEPPGFVSD